MKTNCTHISILLDASFSMTSIIEEMRQGVNNFLEKQKDLDGDCTVTIVKFSGRDHYHEICSFTKLVETPKLTSGNYYPIDSTALIDSMCRLIDETGEKLSRMKEEDRPEKVMFLTITDGEENNSFKFTKEHLKAKTTLQENQYKWQFIYLGANQDAFDNAHNYGIKKMSTTNFNTTSRGINELFSKTSDATVRYRGAGGQSAGFSYTEDEQKDIENTK